jgi:hypothetical protein
MSRFYHGGLPIHGPECPALSWWSASADLAETSAMRLHEKIRMRTPSSRIFSRFGHQSKLGSSDTRESRELESARKALRCQSGDRGAAQLRTCGSDRCSQDRRCCRARRRRSSSPSAGIRFLALDDCLYAAADHPARDRRCMAACGELESSPGPLCYLP